MVSRHRIDKDTDLVVGAHTSWRERRYLPWVPKDPPVKCHKCHDRGVIIAADTDSDDPWATTRTPCDCPTGKRFTDDADDS